MLQARIEIHCKTVKYKQIIGVYNDRIGSQTGAPQHLFTDKRKGD